MAFQGLHLFSHSVAQAVPCELLSQIGPHSDLLSPSFQTPRKTLKNLVTVLHQNRKAWKSLKASGIASPSADYPSKVERKEVLEEPIAAEEKVSDNKKFSDDVTESSPESESDSESTESNRLQKRFGSDSLSFAAASGLIVAQLSVSNGSKVKLIVNEARVTSFRPQMWHQGYEEVLFATASDPEVGETRLLGGVVPLLENNGGTSYRPKWRVVDASREDQEWVQVILEPVEPSPSSVECSELSWQLTVVLTQNALGVVLSATNIGSKACSFSASVASHISVNAADGTYLTGLKDSKYLTGSREGPLQQVRNQRGWGFLSTRVGDSNEKSEIEGFSSNERTSDNTGIEGNIVSEGREKRGSETSRDQKSGDEILESFKAALAGLQTPSRTRWSNVEKVEKAEYSRLRGPLERLYRDAPFGVTLLDRGKRRAFEVDRRGFKDLVVNILGERTKTGGEWDKVICLTSRHMSARKEELQPGQKWEGGFLIRNRGAPDS